MAFTPQVQIRDIHFSYPDTQSKTLAGISLDVKLGECMVLLGESGCGKTTLLRSIAGLEHPDSGSITIGTQVVSETAPPTESSKAVRRFVAAEKRNVGMVFQQWALFPHMSVAANIGYGLKTSKAEKAETVSQLLDQVGLSGYENRSPASLSGGQQQRVALARALAPEPAVLLLDEPFSNLDAALRTRIRAEVQALLKNLNITSIFVTHDQQEAFVLGDRVAVMRSGEILQIDTPKALYRRPVSEYVAHFLGEANILPIATVTQRWNYPSSNPATSAGGAASATSSPGSNTATSAGGAGGDSGSAGTHFVIRPEQFTLSARTDSATSAVITDIDFFGHDALVTVRTDFEPIELLIRTDPFSDYNVGDTVSVGLRDNSVLHTL